MKPRDDSLFFKLVLIVNLTAGPFSRGPQRTHGLTLTEWRVLRTLALAPGLAAADVAERLGLDKMAISRAVRALEEAGRVERRTTEQDNRRSAIFLTEAGTALHAAIDPGGRAREAELLGDLSAAERETLGRLLDRLIVRARALPGRA